MVVAAALVLTACGSSSKKSDSATKTTVSKGDAVHLDGVPGVTDKEISYAVVGTRSNNPLGTCILDCYALGIKAYFEYRNAAGGVHGRKLVVGSVLDDQLGQNQQRALEVVSSKSYFGSFNAPLIPAGWKALNDAGVPTYVWGIHNDAADKDHIFGSITPVCTDCTSRFRVYAAKLVHATKIASLGYGVTPTSKDCADAIAKTFDQYGKDIGAKTAYLNDGLAFGLSNGVGPEVTAMKKAGVDFVMTCIDLNGDKTFAQEMRRQGMDDVPMFHQNLYDQKFVAESGDLFEGDIVRPLFRPFEAEAKGTGLAEFNRWMEKVGATKDQYTETAIAGWINADLAYKGLVAAGPKFDRESVVAATNKMTSFDADGLIVPINWTVGHKAPTRPDRCVALVRVKNNAFETVGPRDKPWLCWPPNTTAWSDPVSTDSPTAEL